jgi:hypothetical protein
MRAVSRVGKNQDERVRQSVTASVHVANQTSGWLPMYPSLFLEEVQELDRKQLGEHHEIRLFDSSLLDQSRDMVGKVLKGAYRAGLEWDSRNADVGHGVPLLISGSGWARGCRIPQQSIVIHTQLQFGLKE